MSRRLGVLISGRGSNLQSIIDAIRRGELAATIAVVVSNRPEAAGLLRASEFDRLLRMAEGPLPRKLEVSISPTGEWRVEDEAGVAVPVSLAAEAGR